MCVHEPVVLSVVVAAARTQSLALKIFTRNPPVDPEPLESHCLECLDEGRAYQACTASGQVGRVHRGACGAPIVLSKGHLWLSKWRPRCPQVF